MTEQQPASEPEGPDRGPIEEHRERFTDADRPRVWIGSLSDYNSGVLHGEWMDAAVSENELRAQVDAMLARSQEGPAEEWMIFDSDNFGPYQVREYEDLETLTTIARGIVEHGSAFAAYANLMDGNTGALDHFSDVLLGAYDSREAWAQEVVDNYEVERAIDRLELPDWLRGHIRVDLIGMARDLELGGDVIVEDNPAGGVWIFGASP